jgi:tetratricopeptide (TPR) repeat protein
MLERPQKSTMSEDLLPPAPMPTATAGAFVGTFAIMAAAIAALLSFDLFLAGIDRRESAAHAANLYAEGRALLAEHRAADAEDRFATAVAIERTNTSYALGLAEAQLDAGKAAEAETTLRNLLERAENDGAVNLVMARALLRSGRAGEAKAYYHRAIFGRWGADSVAQRSRARFELIDLLAKTGSPAELLAELLPLEDAPEDSVALRERLGTLFIAAGSPARAATAFRGVLRRDPENASAYSGLGDAELALGNFRAARADFAAALRLRPGDTGAAAKLASVDSVVALDPTARGLNSAERFARSRALLGRTLDVVVACGQTGAPLVDTARRLLGAKPSAGTREASADSMVAVATSLWSARPASCGASETALRLLHARLVE